MLANIFPVLLGTIICSLTFAPRIISADVTISQNGTSSVDYDIYTTSNFYPTGGKMEFCPTGDCTNGPVMSLVLSSMRETNANGFPVESKAMTNLATMKGEWSSLKETSGTVGETTFTASDQIDGHSMEIQMKATVYMEDKKVNNGNNRFTVPAGALKFSFELKTWPFEKDTNQLFVRFALSVRGANNNNLKVATEGNVRSDETNLDRIDFGDGLYIDAPNTVVLDDDDIRTHTKTYLVGDEMEIEWNFNNYKESLYYDPILGASKMTSRVENEKSASGDRSSSTPSSASDASSSDSKSSNSSSSSASSCRVSGLKGSNMLSLLSFSLAVLLPAIIYA